MSRDDEDEADDHDLDEVDPDSVPTVISRAVVPRPADDPLDRARTALRAARLARGVDPDEPDLPDPPAIGEGPQDPIGRAQSALERAAAVRAEAAQGRAALERENRAKEELQRLKGGAPAAPDAPSEPAGASPKPRKRRL